MLPRAPLSDTTSRVLRMCVRNPLVTRVRGQAGEWSADKTYKVGQGAG